MPMTEINSQIRALAAKLTEIHLSSSLSSIQPIAGKGEVNQIFLLTGSSGQKAILRLNEETEFERFKKEQWCAGMTASRGVPGASVLVVDICRAPALRERLSSLRTTVLF